MGRLTTQEDFAPGCMLPWALQSQLHPHRPSFLNMASLLSFQVFIQALPFPWNALSLLCVAKDGEALYSQQKQDQELTVAQTMNSLLPNSDLN